MEDRMRRLLLACSGVIALFGGSSNAADLAPIYAPPTLPLVTLFTWTGCYIGGNAGGIWANSDWSDTIVGDFGSNTPSGALGGAQAGCDYQASGLNNRGASLVVGIQGDYDWTNVNGSVANVIPSALGFGLTDQTQIKSLASVTGRVGGAWDRFLAYVKGGGAWLRGNYGFQTFGTLVAPTVSLTQTGYTVGVGGEYAFLNWLTGFIEYDYYHFGDNNTSSTLVCTAAVCGIATPGVRVMTDINVVKAGLNLKFGPF
jgi:outer membrane immunogenic protein